MVLMNNSVARNGSFRPGKNKYSSEICELAKNDK